MEVHNARYGGEFKRFGDSLAENAFFEEIKLFTANDIRRMNDVRYCLVLAITIMSTYFNRDSELEDYLERFNEYFDEKDQLLGEAEVVFSFLRKLNLRGDSRAWKKADFFTLFVETHRVIVKQSKTLSEEILSEKLSNFYQRVQAASDGKEEEGSDAFKYYKAALQASNDRGSRILRGEIIGNLLNGAVV